MSSNIKPDTVKIFKGISEEKWIQGPTFKDGTVLHVEYMGGPDPKSVEQRIEELKPSQKLQIEIKDMQNNDTDWLDGMGEMDEAFPDPEDTLNIKNYPTGYFTLEGKVISKQLKNSQFLFIYPRDKFSLKSFSISKRTGIPSLQSLSKYKVSTGDISHYNKITNFTNAGKNKKGKKTKKRNRKQSKKRNRKQSKKRKRISRKN
ncbi:hypothetical protein CL646_05430 [bacterium]|nr:hypothetical protein [bacterium]